MVNTLFGFDYIFVLSYVQLALLSSLLGLYLRFLLNFINSEEWVKTFHHFSIFSLLPLTGFVITSAISDNIALSLGMVGALSIVRFRTPVKNPSELVVYFVLITIGIVLNVDPSKALSFVALITFISIVLEIYKYINNKFNLSIYDFNNKKYVLQLALSKEKPELINNKSFHHVSGNAGENHFIYRFQANSIEDLIDIKNSVKSDNISSYSLDETSL